MYYRLATLLVIIGLVLGLMAAFNGSLGVIGGLIAGATVLLPFLVAAAVLWGFGDIISILRAQFGDIDRRTDAERSHDAAMQRVQERSGE